MCETHDRLYTLAIIAGSNRTEQFEHFLVTVFTHLVLINTSTYM